MKAGQNNKYDITKTCSLVQVCLHVAQRGFVGIQFNGFKCQKDFLWYSYTLKTYRGG